MFAMKPACTCGAGEAAVASLNFSGAPMLGRMILAGHGCGRQPERRVL